MNLIQNLLSRFFVPEPPQEFTEDFDALLSELWEPTRDDYARMMLAGYSSEHRFFRLVRLGANRFGHALTPNEIAAERLSYEQLADFRE